MYDLDCAPWHNFIAGGAVARNCYAQLQANEDSQITKEQFLSFLSDAAEIGVKGVSFISDGESTVVPWYADAVEHAARCGLAVGAGSNGIKLTKPVLERVLPHLSYLRFNFSAGTRKRYAEIMGVPQHNFDTVMQNIRDGMEIIHRDGLGCTLNMQLVLDPKDGDQIIPFAERACELRPVYAIIKHCATDVENSFGINYADYEKWYDDLHRAEEMGRQAGVKITCKWNKIQSGAKRDYDRCYGPPFIMQVSGSGLVAPCGMLFNERYKAFHIGSIARERFKDIWASDRYMEVMNYLGGEHFNPQQRCGQLCLQHATNDFVFRYVNGRAELPTTPPPAHLEFI